MKLWTYWVQSTVLFETLFKKSRLFFGEPKFLPSGTIFLIVTRPWTCSLSLNIQISLASSTISYTEIHLKRWNCTIWRRQRCPIVCLLRRCRHRRKPVHIQPSSRSIRRTRFRCHCGKQVNLISISKPN